MNVQDRLRSTLNKLPWLLASSLLCTGLLLAPHVARAQSTGQAQSTRTIDWQSTVPESSTTALPLRLIVDEEMTESERPFECDRVISDGAADIWLFSPETVVAGAPGQDGTITAQRCSADSSVAIQYALTDASGEVVEIDEPADPDLFSHTFAPDSASGDYVLDIKIDDVSLSESFSVTAYAGPQIRLRDASTESSASVFGSDEAIIVDYVNFEPGDTYETGLYRLGVPHAEIDGKLTLIASWPVQFSGTETAISELLGTVNAPGGQYQLVACASPCLDRWTGAGISRPQIISAEFEIDNPERRVEIGYSTLESPIESVQFGNGPSHVVLVGGMHAGFAPASVELAEEVIDHFAAGYDYGDAITLHVIANANPDSPDAIGKLEGRLNDNGVDLNRNWDCDWRSNAEWAGRPVSGGGAPFSEAETVALRDYIENFAPLAVVFYEARSPSGQTTPGGCTDESLVSQPIADWYSEGTQEAGAEYTSEAFTAYEVNGDATNWLDSQGIPAIAVLLPDYTDPDVEINLVAIEYLLEQLSEQVAE